MDRLPAWILWATAVVFVGLAIWTLTDENWSGVIASAVLAILFVVLAVRRTSRA